jgi:hypothetical protein
MNRAFRLSCCFGVLTVGLLVGCGDEYAGKKAVSGTVTIKGEPLKEGSIQFVALEGGAQTGAGIKDGAYAIERKNGLKPGKYLVRITAADKKSQVNGEEAAGPGGNGGNVMSHDIIPPEYGYASKQQVEVTEKGDNKFEIAIPYAVPPPKGKR